jgi:hypothetical protein
VIPALTKKNAVQVSKRNFGFFTMQVTKFVRSFLFFVSIGSKARLVSCFNTGSLTKTSGFVITNQNGQIKQILQNRANPPASPQTGD